MDAAENRAMIQQAFEAWSGGDGRPFLKLVADDVRWTVIGSTPISRTYTSKTDFRNALRSMSEHLAGELRVVVRDVIADGDKVAVQFDSHAAGKNGTAYDQTYCWVMRVTDGKVREVTAYLDTELLTRLLA
jgi:uncharacterized protein (TIGR02246 family)